MRLSQKMIYVAKQLQFLEKAIVDCCHNKYLEAFGGELSISIRSRKFVDASLYQHFKHYEGPLAARYMLIIQLYSIYERYAISFSKRLSAKDGLIKISDLNGSQNFKGIKTYYSKVVDIEFSDWEGLDKLRQVRNLIAHCDGYITHSEQRNKISRLAESDQDLIILDDQRLALNEEFIKRSMRAVFRFFDIVEPMVENSDNLLDFSWAHMNQFREFDLARKTEQEKAADA